MGAAQLEQARAPPSVFIRNAGGSGRRRGTGVGDGDRASACGATRRGGISLTGRSERVAPFYY